MNYSGFNYVAWPLRKNWPLRSMEGSSEANETEDLETYYDLNLDGFLIDELLQDDMGERLERLDIGDVATVLPTGEKGVASLVDSMPNTTTTGEGRGEQRLTGGLSAQEAPIQTITHFKYLQDVDESNGLAKIFHF